MSLCKALGGMTFEEMLNRMSSEEVNMWIAYNILEKEECDRSELSSSVKSQLK
jgi:hypothetical protein